MQKANRRLLVLLGLMADAVGGSEVLETCNIAERTSHVPHVASTLLLVALKELHSKRGLPSINIAMETIIFAEQECR